MTYLEPHPSCARCTPKCHCVTRRLAFCISHCIARILPTLGPLSMVRVLVIWHTPSLQPKCRLLEYCMRPSITGNHRNSGPNHCLQVLPAGNQFVATGRSSFVCMQAI